MPAATPRRWTDDADALLAQLYALDSAEQALGQARTRSASIALYGHSQASKGWLLRSLCGNGPTQLPVQFGYKTVDYFSHLNPGHRLSQMALRFTSERASTNEAFPLRLALLSEAELVQVFFTHAAQTPDAATFASRLAGWQRLRQPQWVPGITPQEVVSIGQFWRETVPAAADVIDDDQWYQLSQLIPSLDLSARASVWSLLWGEQPELTRQWLVLAHARHQTGDSGDVLAPLSLLTDPFSLPVEGFLTPGDEADQEVLVHPLRRAKRRQPQHSDAGAADPRTGVNA